MATDPEEELYFQEVSRFGAWGVVLVSGGFGILFLLGVIDRYPVFSPDTVLLLILSLSFLFLSWRIHRFSFRPRVRMTNRELELTRFLGSTAYRFDDLVGLATYDRVHPAYSTGIRDFPERRFPCLVLRLRGGRETKFVLPRFRNNAKLLSAIERRSGLEVETLAPDVR